MHIYILNIDIYEGVQDIYIGNFCFDHRPLQVPLDRWPASPTLWSLLLKCLMALVQTIKNELYKQFYGEDYKKLDRVKGHLAIA